LSRNRLVVVPVGEVRSTISFELGRVEAGCSATSRRACRFPNDEVRSVLLCRRSGVRERAGRGIEFVLDPSRQAEKPGFAATTRQGGRRARFWTLETRPCTDLSPGFAGFLVFDLDRSCSDGGFQGGRSPAGSWPDGRHRSAGGRPEEGDARGTRRKPKVRFRRLPFSSEQGCRCGRSRSRIRAERSGSRRMRRDLSQAERGREFDRFTFVRQGFESTGRRLSVQPGRRKPVAWPSAFGGRFRSGRPRSPTGAVLRVDDGRPTQPTDVPGVGLAVASGAAEAEAGDQRAAVVEKAGVCVPGRR